MPNSCLDITAEPVDTEDNGKESYPQNASIEFADPSGSILTVMPPLIDSTHQVRHSNILEDPSNTGPFRLEMPFQMPTPWVNNPGETICAFSQVGMSQFRLDSQVCLCKDPSAKAKGGSFHSPGIGDSLLLFGSFFLFLFRSLWLG